MGARRGVAQGGFAEIRRPSILFTLRLNITRSEIRILGARTFTLNIFQVYRSVVLRFVYSAAEGAERKHIRITITVTM